MNPSQLRTVSVPPPGVAAPASPAPLRLGWAPAAEALRERGVGPTALLHFALAFAATAGIVFLLDHPGLGALLGLVALAAAELSLVPPRPERADVAGYVRGLNPLVDLLLAAGLAAGAAVRQPPLVLVLALLVLLLLAWLPLLKAVAGPGRVPATAALWQRGERLAVLLLGALLGRTVPAFLLVLLVGGLDAWLRVERLDQPLGLERRLGPPVARALFTADGRFTPAARWGSLLAALALLLVLPRSGAWRF